MVYLLDTLSKMDLGYFDLLGKCSVYEVLHLTSCGIKGRLKSMFIYRLLVDIFEES